MSGQHMVFTQAQLGGNVTTNGRVLPTMED